MSLTQLSTSDLRRRDPDWLMSGELSVRQEEQPMPEECIQELKAKDRRLLHSLVVVEPTTRTAYMYVLLAAEKRLREITTLTVPPYLYQNAFIPSVS